MFGIFKKIFGTSQERIIRRLKKIVEDVKRHEEPLGALTDEQLKAKTPEFRQRLAGGETVQDLLPEAYAVVKEVCRRLCGTQVHVSGYDQKWDMVPYDVQVLGAIALHYGYIAEMQTGEGKTLTATLPLYLNALTGQSVHLVTVNDYLAERDCQWVGSILRWLGLKTGVLTQKHLKVSVRRFISVMCCMAQLLNLGLIICAITLWLHARKSRCREISTLQLSMKLTLFWLMKRVPL